MASVTSAPAKLEAVLRDCVTALQQVAAYRLPPAMVALTPSGRATLTLLDLNGLQHVNIRRWLIVLGMHPPE